MIQICAVVGARANFMKMAPDLWDGKASSRILDVLEKHQATGGA